MESDRPLCTWCGVAVGDTDDHLFPECIGGTKALSLPSCRDCQGILSRAELELSRKSSFALYRAMRGPGPRNKKNKTSGIVEAEFILRKDRGRGGYAEVDLRPISKGKDLPSIEIDPYTLKARKRGPSPEVIDALAKKVHSTKKIKKKLLSKSEYHGDLADDPDFWPRVILTVRGNLLIRARNQREARKFESILRQVIERGAFREDKNVLTYETPPKAPLNISMIYNDYKVQRVVAKIAVGLALITDVIDYKQSAALRKSILSEEHVPLSFPVHQIAEPGALEEWSDHQAAVLYSENDILKSGVIIYGALYSIDLGSSEKETPRLPVAATASINGRSTWLLGYDESVRVAREVQNLTVKAGTEKDDAAHQSKKNQQRRGPPHL